MDFFTKKELNGLKGDLKASETAINAEKVQFEKKLINTYGKEMESVFNAQEKIEKEHQTEIVNEPTKKKCFLKRLFSI
jgi:hypothetical protein